MIKVRSFIQAAFSCLVVLTATVHADMVWIEAESMETSGFPSPENNPFAPTAFWETDVLSGGEWVGAKWKNKRKQPRLETDFQVEIPGTYRFYVRKFFSFGAFRWKIDDREWVHVDPEGQESLDGVPFRKEPDVISLNWYRVGDTELSAGTHWLTVEPIYHQSKDRTLDFHPLGYDVFLFSRKVFHPRGKLKPDETYGVQQPGYFAFEPAQDDFKASPIDLRHLNQNQAGDRGGLVFRDGKIVYRKDGSDARLVTANVRAPQLLDEGQVEYFSRTLAKKGFNVIRISLTDSLTFVPPGKKNQPGGFQMDGESAEALSRAIRIFKQDGIYCALSWSPGMVEGVEPYLEVVEPFPPTSLTLIFDPEFRAMFQQSWLEILRIALGEGKALGEDPALALITLEQQSTPFDVEAKISPRLQKLLSGAFGAWASETYGSCQQALEAWGPGRSLPGDQPEEGRLHFMSPVECSAQDSKRTQDTIRFLAEKRRQFIDETIQKIRKEGNYTGLISPTNKSVQLPHIFGYADLWSRQPGDVLELHANYQTDYRTDSFNWSISEGVQYRDRSALKFEQREDFTGQRFQLPLRCLDVVGQGEWLTEINWTLPNRYRGEMPMISTVLASLQGIQGVGLGYFDQLYWRSFTGTARTPGMTPGIVGQFPAFIYAYRQGYLQAGDPVARLGIQEKNIFRNRSWPLVPNADTQVGRKNFPVPVLGPQQGGADPQLWLTGRIELSLDEDSGYFDVLDAPGIGENFVSSSNGQVLWNYDKGVMVVDTPSFKAVGGSLDQADVVVLKGLELESNMPLGFIAVVSLDGRPLDFSEKMLIQIFSEEKALDRFADGADWKTIHSLGRPPILVRNFSGRLRFDRPDVDHLKITALDMNGKPSATAAVGGTLHLLPHSMYYLVEKIQ